MHASPALARRACARLGLVVVLCGLTGLAHGQPSDPSQPLPLAPGAATALGPAAPRRGPVRVNLAIDLPVTLLSGAVAAGIELVKHELPGPYCGLSCSVDELNPLDRTVVGNQSPAARTASDVLLFASVGLPVVADLIDSLGSAAAHKYPGWARDAMRSHGESLLVMAEALGLNLMFTNLVKIAVRRPRPLVYDPQFPRGDRIEPDAALSFFSGHSSTAFTMATAYSMILTLRHPDRPGLYVPIWILAEGAALATAVLRVEAGKHFYTDVLVGATVGTMIGVAVPLLHRRAAGTRIGGLALRPIPLILPGGAGLGLVLR